MPKTIRSLILGNSRVQRAALASTLETLQGIEVVYSVRCNERAISRISTGDIDVLFLLISPGDGLQDDFLAELSGCMIAQMPFIAVTAEQRVDVLRRLRSFNLRTPHYFSMPTTPEQSSVFAQDVRRALRLKPPTRKLSGPRVSLSSRPEMLCLVSSTGGPEALGQVLSDLKEDFELPILITQHMPEPFVDNMCENLSRHAKRPVTRAVDGCPIVAGGIYVAPGDAHLCVRKVNGNYLGALDYGPPSAGCRPAGNVMLESVAKASGGRMLAVCLTGMGQDGTLGMACVREAGGFVIVQDEASSVVWGMPGSIVEQGYAHLILPCRSIAGKVLELLGKGGAVDVSCAS